MLHEVDAKEQETGREAGGIGDVERRVNRGEGQSTGEEDGLMQALPGSWSQLRQKQECGEVQCDAGEDVGGHGDGPGQQREGYKADDGRWWVDGVEAGGVDVDLSLGSVGLMPGGEEGGRVVGVLLEEPEAG